jgi:NAD(P)H-dependent FMN reductase
VNVPASSSVDDLTRRLGDVHSGTLLGVCASLKPGPGRGDRSAARGLLSYALQTVSTVYPEVALLDLREYPPPLFDGRGPHENEDPALRFIWSCIHRAGALLLSVPAYWSGVSGVFKNLIDTLCGPAYDMAGPIVTVFKDKPVGVLIVGAEEESARAGVDQARRILLATGARLVDPPVVVSNPRSGHLQGGLLAGEMIALAGELAQHAYRAQRGGRE